MGLSLNDLAEKIYSSRTKEYFQEVLTSYQIGNYRSAVVMLWSVVVYDLLHKLDHLDSRGNEQAKAILKGIEKEQKDNPRSSTWERTLLSKAQESLKLITISEYENLNYLHGQRHLCAHPAIDNERKLHSPNKESVRALIVNSLVDLLIKPPFYSKEIFNEILSDIADNQSHFTDGAAKLKQYLQSKYISHLNFDVRESIFSSLWRLVFKVDNAECSKNRVINFYALQAFADSLGEKFLEVISSDLTKYNDINFKKECLNLFIIFLSKRNFYSKIDESVKIHIDKSLEESLDLQIISWFKEGEVFLDKYLKRLQLWIESNENKGVEDNRVWKYAYDRFETDKWEKRFLSVGLLYFKNSYEYDAADERFNAVVAPFLDDFNQSQLNELLTIINGNSQIYARNRAKSDNYKVYERIKALSESDENLIIDLTLYPNFKY